MVSAYGLYAAIMLCLYGPHHSLATATAAFAMTWSSQSFGPDGPWQAIQVLVGSPAQEIALYPGGTFQSHLLTSKICSNLTLTPGLCYASLAGTYTPNSSFTSLDTLIKATTDADFLHGALEVQGLSGISSLDQMDLGTSLDTIDSLVVPNVTIAFHDAVNLMYPGGLSPPLEVGTLGLGFLGTVNQTYGFLEGPVVRHESPINGSLIPGILQAQGITASNSFGLHIGSAALGISGSLYFGGFDRSRIVGDITTQQGAVAGLAGQGLIDLLDVGLEVVDGASPWNATSIYGLLAAGNTTIGSALQVSMRPEAPYLDLPSSTCDAIAAWLPITYQASLGLYTWDTNDPQYTRIVTSPSVLSFVFRRNQVNTVNITIKVPFALLNLTLEAPLTVTPTLYFPCNAQSHGRYSMGRAFLQAAFLGTNWNANKAKGVWWLAQAPGPNVDSYGDLLEIQDQDISISSSRNSWFTSWESSWTPLQANAHVANKTILDPSVASSTGSTAGRNGSMNSSDQGNYQSKQVGIGIGVAVLAVAFIGAGLCALRRRQRKRKAKSQATNIKRTNLNVRGLCPGDMKTSVLSSEAYRTGGYGPVELHSSVLVAHELQA